MKLRRAVRDDCRLLWEWANDPAVRQWSFSSQPIPWADHVAWFEQKLNDPNVYLFLVLDTDEQPLAQVRFDLDGSRQAEVSLSVDPARRAQGNGVKALLLAVQKLFAESDAKSAVAYIKPENRASLRVFETAGFRHAGSEMKKGFSAVKMILKPEAISVG